ncbi:endonuclease III [Sorangium cellulosum So0157-2]|uniref:Endonuclease III n=1 Tax=Sorangium cellulosum So0157-2 TaxID=1254432 RepID=S4XPE7_SORCE|nr:endonuclease III [Sorangium cellulosum So0157-2]
MRRGNAPSSAETAKRGPGGSPAPVGRGARRPPGAAAGDRPAPARPRPGTPPQTTFARLRALHPDAHCELDHTSSFELLVATVLSAQTTDVLVNKVTPHLFAAYPDARALAGAEPAEVGALLRRLGMGMFNQKARNVVGLARGLVERHGGEVPRTLAELVELPGVGRKTANVVLGVAFGAPEGVVVDTHVQRLSQRLGWTKSDKPEQIERDLMALFPKRDWDMLSHTLIFHGRRICFARKPACGGCGINEACPSAFHAENVGRKAPRSPRRGGTQA